MAEAAGGSNRPRLPQDLARMVTGQRKAASKELSALNERIDNLKGRMGIDSGGAGGGVKAIKPSDAQREFSKEVEAVSKQKQDLAHVLRLLSPRTLENVVSKDNLMFYEQIAVIEEKERVLEEGGIALGLSSAPKAKDAAASWLKQTFGKHKRNRDDVIVIFKASCEARIMSETLNLTNRTREKKPGARKSLENLINATYGSSIMKVSTPTYMEQYAETAKLALEELYGLEEVPARLSVLESYSQGARKGQELKYPQRVFEALRTDPADIKTLNNVLGIINYSLDHFDGPNLEDPGPFRMAGDETRIKTAEQLFSDGKLSELEDLLNETTYDTGTGKDFPVMTRDDKLNLIKRLMRRNYHGPLTPENLPEFSKIVTKIKLLGNENQMKDNTKGDPLAIALGGGAGEKAIPVIRYYLSKESFQNADTPSLRSFIRPPKRESTRRGGGAAKAEEIVDVAVEIHKPNEIKNHLGPLVKIVNEWLEGSGELEEIESLEEDYPNAIQVLNNLKEDLDFLKGTLDANELEPGLSDQELLKILLFPQVAEQMDVSKELKSLLQDTRDEEGSFSGAFYNAMISR